MGEQEGLLETLGVTLNREKTRIVHIAHGFEFLGFKIQRGKAQLKLTRDRIKSQLNRQNLYAIPTQRSMDQFEDQIRALTTRRIPRHLGELIETINPIIRGCGNYYCRSHVSKALPSAGWLDHPNALVAPHQSVSERSLEGLSDRMATQSSSCSGWFTDPFASGRKSPFMKAGCGKTTSSLCGGRRPGQEQSSAPPPTRHL